MPPIQSTVPEVVSSSKLHLFVETLRRYILVVGIFLSAAFATWTDFRPYYAVSAADKSETEQVITKVNPTHVRSKNSLIGDTEDNAETTPVVVVNSPEWEAWFNRVDKSLTNGEVPEDWWFRLASYDLNNVKRFKEKKTSFKPDILRLVFAEGEGPVADLFKGKKPGSECLVMFDSGDDRQLFKVYYSMAPELHGLGSGIYGVPDAFSYPLRYLWYFPLLGMLLLYAILPVANKADNICSYKRWQVVLSDFVGCLLYGCFAAAPLFIVGGFQEALSTWIGFTAFFWGMAALGLWALWWSYFYAVYRIYVLADQLVFVCPGNIKAVPFADIMNLESVRVVPPKWLIIMSFAAALLGKGSSSAGQAGRASLLAASSSEGICIDTKSGDSVYVWISNSMGQNSLDHLDLLLDSLQKANAKELPQMREFEAFLPPYIEPSSKKKSSKLYGAEAAERPLLERASESIKAMNDDESGDESNSIVTSSSSEEIGQAPAERSFETVSVSDSRMEALAVALKSAHDDGKLSDSEYKKLHAKFYGTDPSGELWTVSLKGKLWHQKIKGKWVAVDKHPQKISLSSDVVNALDVWVNQTKKKMAKQNH